MAPGVPVHHLGWQIARFDAELLTTPGKNRIPGYIEKHTVVTVRMAIHVIFLSVFVYFLNTLAYYIFVEPWFRYFAEPSARQRRYYMQTFFYLSLFPNQALIASQLEPRHFGSYMATGKKNGSFERIIFIEIEGNFGKDFDWDYARKRCVMHDDGRPKNSVWLSVYRALEFTPLKVMKSMYLATKDGRTLELPKADYNSPGNASYYVYNELCPINPLVVSRLEPHEFAAYMTNPKVKVSVPKVVFADLKTIDLDNSETTGNIGATYDRNLEHFKDCVNTVLDDPQKMNKNVERSHSESFSYNIINRGIYVGEGEQVVYYPMPDTETLRQNHYDWARSAFIL